MNAYLLKPVSIEQLRTTLERWLPITSENNTGGPKARRQPAAAIDREVLAGWLGDDRAAIDSLLGKFCETAVETQSEIDAASQTGNLANLAAAAHKLRGAAQAVGATGVAAAAAALEQGAKPATAHTAATCLARSRRKCATPLWTSRVPAYRRDMCRPVILRAASALCGAV
jgi:HPt (histidine-containing phosphotransfer) domain-containing protein